MFGLSGFCAELWPRLRAGAAERGQDLVEYALLIALLALATIAAITLGGTAVSQIFIDIWNEFQRALAAAA